MFDNWWLDNVSADSKIMKFKHLFEYQKNTSAEPDPTVLSLTLKGVKIRDISNNEGQLAASYEDYALVQPGDFVLNPMDLVSGSVAISPYRGVASKAYFIFTIRPECEDLLDPAYAEYFLWTCFKENIFFPFGKGLGRPEQGGGRCTLNRETLKEFPIIVPPIEVQRSITQSLRSEISKIDEEIELLEKMLENSKIRRNKVIAVDLGILEKTDGE